MNSPLNSSNGNKRLETMAIGRVAGAGAGDLSSQGNPTTKPEAHCNDLDGRDHELVRKPRIKDRCEAQVGDGHDGCPTAVEEHIVDGVGEGPFAVECTDDWGLLGPCVGEGRMRCCDEPKADTAIAARARMPWMMRTG